MRFSLSFAAVLWLAVPVALPVALPIATPVLANDGFGGLSATGLTFGQTDAVAMLTEDLFISLDRIAVDYVFANTTDSDVTGEVIFPMPPVPASSTYETMFNLPEVVTRDNLVNFTATVDGQPVAVKIDRIAVLTPEITGEEPLAAQYDTPGRDVTADLARLGLPLTLDVDRNYAALMALSPAQKAQAEAEGLATFSEGDPAQGYEPEAYAQWSLVLRYHWTQTFPAGRQVRISHTYENLPPGGLFGWTHPPEDYDGAMIETYCIDTGTSKAMAKALRMPEGDDFIGMGMAYNLSYVLRTANSWAGPIRNFRLTLDKGATGNVISLCANGVKKTGPTTFVVEKTDYTPDRDLEILLIVPARPD